MEGQKGAWAKGFREEPLKKTAERDFHRIRQLFLSRRDKVTVIFEQA